MLTGEEKIKNLTNDDICNYIGFSLSSEGAKQVIIKNEGYYDTYKVLYVIYTDGCQNRIAFNCERAINITLEELKQTLLTAIKLHRSAQKNDIEIENTQLKKVLKDIRAMVDFKCECCRGEMCICNVCDKYDAIINKIDGALKEDADK